MSFSFNLLEDICLIQNNLFINSSCQEDLKKVKALRVAR